MEDNHSDQNLDGTGKSAKNGRVTARQATIDAKSRRIEAQRAMDRKRDEEAHKVAELKRQEEQQENDRLDAVVKKKDRKKLGIALPLIILCIAALIIVQRKVIPSYDYRNAVDLMEEGKYHEAIAEFRALQGYKDSDEKILECEAALNEVVYVNAVKIMDDGHFDDAIAVFESLHGYKDSKDLIVKCMEGKYNLAPSILAEGNYKEAVDIYYSLEEYKDSHDLAQEICKQHGLDTLEDVDVGDVVYFGQYEQDDNPHDGKEYVEWVVLEKRNGKTLVISRYGLDCKWYNPQEDTTWEDSYIRSWLNSTFYDGTFSEEEKGTIMLANVRAEKNPVHDTKPGNATRDRVFLLSQSETEQYCSTVLEGRCMPTKFAMARGVYCYENCGGDCGWWLRSPGLNQSSAAFVNEYGWASYDGIGVEYGWAAVRPALWINLEKV